ncbi:hypothetical protein ACLOJK_024094, partial [Asimina triloba]
ASSYDPHQEDTTETLEVLPSLQRWDPSLTFLRKGSVMFVEDEATEASLIRIQ